MDCSGVRDRGCGLARAGDRPNWWVDARLGGGVQLLAVICGAGRRAFARQGPRDPARTGPVHEIPCQLKPGMPPLVGGTKNACRKAWNLLEI